MVESSTAAASSSWSPLPRVIYYILSLLVIPGNACLALYVIFTCARLTFESGVLPPEMKYPPISLFGVKSPERELYKMGFPAVALLFFIAVAPISRFMMAFARGSEEKSEAWKCVWTSVLAFVGLGIHGWVPLHESILKQIRGESVLESEAEGANLQNGIHQGAAAVFFMLSLYHGVTVVKLLYGSETHPLGIVVSPILGTLSLSLKAICLACQFFPSILGLVGHPVMNSLTGLDLNQNDIGGLSQWWTVGCLVCFYVTYSVDLLIIARYQPSVDAQGRHSKKD